MKKPLLILLVAILFFACESTDSDYPLTKFYVKNTSSVAISFDASVIKPSQTGSYEVKQSFTVHPNDSVLAREIGFKRDGKEPQNWFNTFQINPVDGIVMNNPNLASNWVKFNVANNPFYVFTLNKD